MQSGLGIKSDDVCISIYLQQDSVEAHYTITTRTVSEQWLFHSLLDAKTDLYRIRDKE